MIFKMNFLVEIDDDFWFEKDSDEERQWFFNQLNRSQIYVGGDIQDFLTAPDGGHGKIIAITYYLRD